jgi:uncharacterized membrane protein
MKTISHFVATTVLGGLLFLAPIVVLALVLGKAYDFARRGLQPVAKLIPDRLASGPAATAILAILVIALACFLAGLVAQTLWAKRLVNELEASILSKVPGYEYLKQAGTSVLGVSESAEHPVVLVELGGGWRIGVQTDVVGENLVAVFVPNAPNPLSGGVFLVGAERVHPADIPLAAAMGALRRCGTGSAVLAESIAAQRP